MFALFLAAAASAVLTSLFNWRRWWWWANICKHLSDEGKEAHAADCLFVDAAAITVLAN